MPLPRTLSSDDQELAFMTWLSGYELAERRELRVVDEHAARLAFLAGVKHGEISPPRSTEDGFVDPT